MSGAQAAAAAVQAAGGVALSPLVPGLVQTAKARLQGRRGASPLQPYRELRRLWRRTPVQPEGAGPVYRAAPAVAVAALAACVAVVPIAGQAPPWGLGSDALALLGLLALARVAVAAAAWDGGSGFALMGSARDLTFAVSGEALLALALLLAALPAGTTDLAAMGDAAAGAGAWGEPAHWCGALALGLVVLLETGRQPIDNPDTHLELTMVHEGPLLEYAGRDLALLQWAAAARHWVVLALAADLAVPHPVEAWPRLAVLAAAIPSLCLVLAVVETWQAKLRLLVVPRLLWAGAGIALLGLVSWYAGSGA